MIQDILTYLTLAGAAVYGLYRLYRTVSMIARGESPGCGSCPLHRTMIE